MPTTNETNNPALNLSAAGPIAIGLGGLLDHWPDSLRVDDERSTVGRIHACWKGMAAVLDGYNRDRTAIHQNVELSATGKQNKLRELFVHTNDLLEELRAPIGPARTEAKKLEESVRGKMVPKQVDMQRFMLLQEIRTWLLSLDVSGRTKAVAIALRDTDFDTMDAVLSAPKAFRLIEDSLLERVETERKNALDPETVAAIKRLNEAADILEKAVDVVARAVMRDAGHSIGEQATVKQDLPA